MIPNESRPQVGDVYVNTWGYDQTQVDAYQVVRVLPKTMELRQIITRSIPGTQGFMCQHCIPVPYFFKEGSRPFRVRTGGKSPDGFGLNYGYASKWDGNQTYYESWYA
jgi:hypothetical protein